jgi:hypothetical protein
MTRRITASSPHTPTWHWKARALNGLAKQALALTMRAYWAGILGPSATKVGLSIASKLNRSAFRHSRRRSVRGQPVRDMLSDPQSRYVLNRFLLKLVVLSNVAPAQIQAPLGIKIAVTTLAIFSALLSAGLALVWGERPVAGTLNYWDEVAAFFGHRGRRAIASIEWKVRGLSAQMPFSAELTNLALPWLGCLLDLHARQFQKYHRRTSHIGFRRAT